MTRAVEIAEKALGGIRDSLNLHIDEQGCEIEQDDPDCFCARCSSVRAIRAMSAELADIQ